MVDQSFIVSCRLLSYRVASYRIVMHHTASYYVVLYRIALYRIVWYCIALYCIVLCCVVLCCVVLCCVVLCCIVLYCIVLYCTVLCIVSGRTRTYNVHEGEHVFLHAVLAVEFHDRRVRGRHHFDVTRRGLQGFWVACYGECDASCDGDSDHK